MMKVYVLMLITINRSIREALRSELIIITSAQCCKQEEKTGPQAQEKSFLRTLSRLFLILILLLIAGGSWLYFAPSAHNLRYLIADTLITTQHRYMAKYIIGEDELKDRVKEYNERFVHMGDEKDTHTIVQPPVEVEKPLVEIEEVSGTGYSGYVMTVNDPTKVRLGVPGKIGSGEKVSSMVSRTGAIAGVNGGGFADPNWKGNGFKPIGLVISQGNCFTMAWAEKNQHKSSASISKAK